VVVGKAYDFVLWLLPKVETFPRSHRFTVGERDLRLDLHPGKSRVYRVADGVTFLGWRIFPDRTRLVRPNIVRFRRRMRAIEARYAAGGIAWKEVEQRVRAWLAHASHGDTCKLRERLLDEFSFTGGRRAI
jgi:RNA-directed DNA polymerase